MSIEITRVDAYGVTGIWDDKWFTCSVTTAQGARSLIEDEQERVDAALRRIDRLRAIEGWLADHEAKVAEQRTERMRQSRERASQTRARRADPFGFKAMGVGS